MHLVDNFLTIFRRDMTTPYTSLASSSKGSPVSLFVDGTCALGCGFSFTATTIPVLDDSVFRGLLKAEILLVLSTWLTDVGATDCDTAGKVPPGAAGFGLLALCQSW